MHAFMGLVEHAVGIICIGRATGTVTMDRWALDT